MSGGTIWMVQLPIRTMKNVEPTALVYDRAHSIVLQRPEAEVAHLFKPGELTAYVNGYKDCKGRVHLNHRANVHCW